MENAASRLHAGDPGGHRPYLPAGNVVEFWMTVADTVLETEGTGMKTLLYIPLALGIAFGAAAFAEDARTTGEIARAGEATQGEIQGDSRKLVAEIDATIDEYERNGLSGEESNNLKNLRQ